jgi:D-cysteine desulfhydrase
VEPVPRRPLFERLPRLREHVPWEPLAEGLPTPLEQVDDHLWVKRDDLTSSLYGGNKVRKLEFLLAQAAERGGPVVTAGATGSHFAVAAATHAQKLGVPVEVVRFPQPMTPHVREIADRFAALPADEVHAQNPYLFPLLQVRRWWERRQEGALFVPGGGSSPFGTLGYVNAALELVEDHERAGLAEPDEIVVAASTCGTAVGLALGLALAGWHRAVVVAVRVADLALTNPVWIGQLRARTHRVLRRAGSGRLSPRLLVDGRWLGPGYGHATPEGERATEVGAGYGLTLEPTYTAKAFAAVLDRAWPGKRIVYVHTFGD